MEEKATGSVNKYVGLYVGNVLKGENSNFYQYIKPRGTFPYLEKG